MRLFSTVILTAAFTFGTGLQCQSQPSLSDFLPHKYSFELIQKLGGIKIGTPFRVQDNTVLLPVDCDVSGTRKITVKPITLNSAAVIKTIVVKIVANEIHLTVVTGLGHGNSWSEKPVSLGKLNAGNFKVFYDSPGQDAIFLTQVTVPR